MLTFKILHNAYKNLKSKITILATNSSRKLQQLMTIKKCLHIYNFEAYKHES